MPCRPSKTQFGMRPSSLRTSDNVLSVMMSGIVCDRGSGRDQSARLISTVRLKRWILQLETDEITVEFRIDIQILDDVNEGIPLA
jgi:hypothetical protein